MESLCDLTHLAVSTALWSVSAGAAPRSMSINFKLNEVAEHLMPPGETTGLRGLGYQDKGFSDSGVSRAAPRGIRLGMRMLGAESVPPIARKGSAYLGPSFKDWQALEFIR